MLDNITDSLGTGADFGSLANSVEPRERLFDKNDFPFGRSREDVYRAATTEAAMARAVLDTGESPFLNPTDIFPTDVFAGSAASSGKSSSGESRSDELRIAFGELPGSDGDSSSPLARGNSPTCWFVHAQPLHEKELTKQTKHQARYDVLRLMPKIKHKSGSDGWAAKIQRRGQLPRCVPYMLPPIGGR